MLEDDLVKNIIDNSTFDFNISAPTTTSSTRTQTFPPSSPSSTTGRSRRTSLRITR